MSSLTSWAGSLSLPDFALVVVLLVALAALLTVARRRGAGWPWLMCAGLFGGYLVLVAVVVFCPLSLLRAPPSAFPGAPGPPAFVVNTHFDLYGLLHNRSLENQNLLNVVLTVPFGLGLPLVVRRSAPWLVGACAALPIGIESTQLLFSLAVGHAYRDFEVDDLVTNLSGGLLGLVLFTVARFVVSGTAWRERDPRHHLGAFLALAARRFQPPGSASEQAQQRRGAARAALAAVLGVVVVTALAYTVDGRGTAGALNLIGFLGCRSNCSLDLPARDCLQLRACDRANSGSVYTAVLPRTADQALGGSTQRRGC